MILNINTKQPCPSCEGRGVIGGISQECPGGITLECEDCECGEIEKYYTVEEFEKRFLGGEKLPGNTSVWILSRFAGNSWCSSLINMSEAGSPMFVKIPGQRKPNTVHYNKGEKHHGRKWKEMERAECL